MDREHPPPGKIVLALAPEFRRGVITEQLRPYHFRTITIADTFDRFRTCLAHHGAMIGLILIEYGIPNMEWATELATEEGHPIVILIPSGMEISARAEARLVHPSAQYHQLCGVVADCGFLGGEDDADVPADHDVPLA